MDFCPLFKRPRTTQQLRRRTPWRFPFPLLPPLPMMILLLTVVLVVAFSWTRLHPGFFYSYHSRIVSDLGDSWSLNDTTSIFQFQDHGKAAAGTTNNSSKSYFKFSQVETTGELFYTPVDHQTGAFSSPSPSPQELHRKTSNGPYQDWDVFSSDYQEMMRTLKIFVYPDAYKENYSSSSPFDIIFLPLANLMDPKLGNYFSEHAFKVALLGSSLVTRSPEEAHFFFMPFSINVMRNHPLLHSASSISDFVAEYTRKIGSKFRYWNASGGADHFYVCCHSIGREAASKHPDLHTKAIQVTCSSSYFQRLYITHKDIGLPQIWPRQPEPGTNPPSSRKLLVFFAGRAQNSLIRQKILDMWSNDTSFAIFSGSSTFPYEEGFKRSKYCLHVKGYEVNTARVTDAIQYGCIPVLISNYYDLPFANVLDWSKFAIIIGHEDIPLLKEILLSVSKKTYLMMYRNLDIVRKHFIWHTSPRSYDAFYMTAYQLWLRRGLSQIFPSTP